MGVLYLAKKYMVPSLVDKCEQFLGENLDATNVFSILPFAEKYEARNLMAICWKLLDKESEDAFKSDAFSTIERSLLEVVVKRYTLNIKEINLFFAIDKWARKACERQGLIARGKVKRRILGENVVKEIRSPVMTFYEFAKFVIDCQILTQKEVSDIVKLDFLSSTELAQLLSSSSDVADLIQLFLLHQVEVTPQGDEIVSCLK